MDAADARTLLAKFGLVADHVTRPADDAVAGRAHAGLARPADGQRRQRASCSTSRPTTSTCRRSSSSSRRSTRFDGTVLLVTHDRARCVRPTRHAATSPPSSARRRVRGHRRRWPLRLTVHRVECGARQPGDTPCVASPHGRPSGARGVLARRCGSGSPRRSPSRPRPRSQGWPAIAAGAHTLICAPTGSGKTLTAFLASIDRLVTTPPPDAARPRTRLLYISPLRALAFDVEKNLRAPLMGIGLAAERLGVPFRRARRWPCAPATRRPRTAQALVRHPPDLLITTPESLYLMLTSTARETLVNVETVIIDEIHALAATKRGAHLRSPSSGSRSSPADPPQRIGLSATQRPLEEIARFLGGYADAGRAAAGHHRRRRHPQAARDRGRRPGRGHGRPRQAAPSELRSGPASPRSPQRTSIWPSIYPRILAAGARPPLHDHLLQRPPPGRAPGRPAQRAGRRRSGIGDRPEGEAATVELVQGPPRLARPRAAARHRGPAQARRAAGLVATSSRSSSASTWARSTSSSRSSRPARSAAACSASAGPATGRRAEPGHDLPQAPRRPARGGGRRPAHARRR